MITYDDYLNNVSIKNVVSHSSLVSDKKQSGQLAFLATEYTENAECVLSLRQQGIHLPETLSQACLKRQAEFLAGRFCAYMVLQQLGADCLQTGINNDRSPDWPPGFTGSISHSSGLALAVAGRTSEIRSLGVDIEPWVSHSSAVKLQNAVLTRQDQQFCHDHVLDLGWLFTLIFSAKESLYKLLYPEIRQFFGFKAAAITSLDQQQKTFTLQLTQSLSSQWQKGHCFHGVYFEHDEKIITLLVL